MAVKEGAYIAVIVVLAVLVGAMGAYIYLQHTNRSVTTTTQTQTTTGTTPPTTTIVVTPTTTTTATATSTPTITAAGVCLSGAESYNETYTLIPPNIPTPSYNALTVMNTYFYVPFGTTATYYFNVQANATVITVDIANSTATEPEVILPQYIYASNGQVESAEDSGTLTPGLYELDVENLGMNTYVQVTQQLVVKYSPTSGNSKCYGKITGSATTTLGLSPPLTPPPPYDPWMFGFFVPQGATGNVTVTYTSNTTLQVEVTDSQISSTFYVPPQNQQSGTYTVTNLPPGEYYVTISTYNPNSYATLNVNVTAEYSGT